MKEDSEREDRADGRAVEPAADDTSASEGRTVPSGGDENEFALLSDQESAVNATDAAGDASRVDGLPDGWLDADAVVGRGGSGPLDLFAEAEEALRGAGSAVEESGVSHASRVLIGTGQSGIVAASDLLPEAGSDDPGSPHAGQGTDDAVISRPGDTGPAERSPDDSSTDREPGSGVAEEWGDLVAASVDEGPSESVGFGALLAQDAAEQEAASDSYADDSQGIVRGTEEAIEMAVPVIAATRPVRPRQGGGIGQLVGVILGGVLAIPVTLAILMWGFQRDPLGLAKQVPEGLRFVLPRAVRRAGEPRVPVVPSSTLDSIATSAMENLQVATPAAEGATDSGAANVATPVPEPVFDPSTSDQAPAPHADAGGAIDDPAVNAAPSGPSVPSHVDDAAIAVDVPEIALGSDVAPRPPRAAPDLVAFDAAVERALLATENLGRIDPSGDPQDREQSLVAWYRGLADAASALAIAEKAVSEGSGLPDEPVRRYDALATRLASERVSDIADLGTMWLTAARRPSEGAVLVGVLEEERAAGPWRWGRLTLRGGEPRSIAFFTRDLGAAKAGDEVIVSGVLGDASAMWVSDIRPVVERTRSASPEDRGAVDADPVEPAPEVPVTNEAADSVPAGDPG